MATSKTNIAFILVRPEFLGNIGAVARAMKNFGFSDLRFVEPPKNYKDAEARKMAVGAFDLLKGAKIFASLKDAVQDLNYVVGTSSGKQRKQTFVGLEQVADYLETGDVKKFAGIVFGDEKNGLSSDELDYCHATLNISTDPQFPVLNLAQAACITAYALSTAPISSTADSLSPPASSRDPNPSDKSGELSVPPSMKELDQLFDQIKALLKTSGFARERNEAQVMLELQSFFQRALPTRREFDLLNGAVKTIHKTIHPIDPTS